MDEKLLVRRAQAGDFEAFTDLIKAHKDRIYGLALRLSGNSQDAEDVVQDTFLKAIDKIDQFRLESSFGTWLYSIALNQARAMLARRKQEDLKPIEEYLPVRVAADDDSGGHGHGSHGLFEWKDPEKLLEDKELRQAIDKLIAELPYQYREAFLLRYDQGLSVKEIAAIINESEAATKSRILRARLALREKLSEIFETRYDREVS
ncbi:MAG: sigma-70 family RNA polymerase sigma factor [Candidatus Zixiibacteriota bacterium]